MSVRKTVQFNRTRCLAAALAASCALSGGSLAQDTSEKIVLTKMGAYSFAGKIISNSAGRSLHCDHGYAQFQIPEKPRQLPIVFWHSASAIHWESTPDGREGFQSMFLRRGYPIYLIDVPRLGRAGNGCEEFTYKACTRCRSGWFREPTDRQLESTFRAGVQSGSAGADHRSSLGGSGITRSLSRVWR